VGTLTGHFSLWAKGSRVILELVFSHHACLAFSYADNYGARGKIYSKKSLAIGLRVW
jgi:hypothetical protein